MEERRSALHWISLALVLLPSVGVLFLLPMSAVAIVFGTGRQLAVFGLVLAALLLAWYLHFEGRYRLAILAAFGPAVLSVAVLVSIVG